VKADFFSLDATLFLRQTSYRLTAASTFSQRFGDFAGILFPDTAGVNMIVQRVNSTTPETLNVRRFMLLPPFNQTKADPLVGPQVPYQSFYLGENFSDSSS